MSNDNKLFIQKRDRVLLLHSVHFKSELYREYRDLLVKNKRITNGLVNSLPHEKQSFMRTVLRQVIREAHNEWQADESKIVEDKGEGNTDIKCSLCATGNRYIFYIKNKISGEKLNVGSDCIEDFVNDGLKLPTTIADLKKNATKIQRMFKLNSLIPDVNEKIEKWAAFLDKQPIYIPKERTKNYYDLMNTTQALYKDYLENGHKNDSVAEIAKNLETKEEYELNIERYVKQKIDVPFIVTKNIIKNLQRNGNKTALRMIESDNGFITSRTAGRVTETNFISFIINLLNTHFDKVDSSIVSMDHDRGQLVFQMKPLTRVNLYIGYQLFMEEVGMIIFGEEPIEMLTKSYLLQQSNIYESESAEIALKQMEKNLGKKFMKIAFISYNENEIIVHSRKSNQYHLCKMDNFINDNLKWAFGGDKNVDLSRSIKVMTHREYQLYREAKKVAKDMNRSINR
ncbi:MULTISPECIES: hypothetical protein [Alkalihalophilus]|uniref:Uncharacterized protein n=1 Tax=Alkalihalophilus pseudofirmus (strain ATCC BAA-2126 / JCM 17055 / OF4) TaxID=398511 RepID=D3G1K6_ALKPO|nr:MULTISPECIES: hypothetical protein [Alkalihalophilus]ADC52232.1 hypothetical protein BpOF4_21184 [Alkalihalophilus pseudofirmus OF4]MEC2074358.1 hypothetical protein [Alkalihalophilus marmarensis]